jgi:hypothetical protein
VAAALGGAAAAALAAGLVLVATAPHGAGLSPDAAAYVMAARALRDGRAPVSIDGGPFVHWPPGYPLLLAAVAAGRGGDPADAAPLVGALAHAAAALLTAAWLRRHVRRAGLVALGAVTVALAPPLLGSAVFTWSEASFVALSLWALLALETARDGAPGRGTWPVGVPVALAWGTRYLGLALLVTAVALLLAWSGGPPAARLRRAAGVTAVAGVPMALWVGRNLWLSGWPAGSRGWTRTTAAGHAWGTVRTVARWVVPVPGGPGEPLATGAAVSWLALASAGLAAVVLLALLWRPLRRLAAGPLAVPAGFAVVYGGLLLGVASVVWFDPLGDRLLAPLYVPLLVVACRGLDAGLDRVGVPVARAALAAAALLPAATGAGRAAGIVVACRTSGCDGRPLGALRASVLLAELRAHPGPGPVLSNRADAIAVAGGMPARFLRRALLQEPGAAARLPPGTRVAWLREPRGEPSVETVAAVGARAGWRLVFSGPEGAVWVVAAPGGAGPRAYS